MEQHESTAIEMPRYICHKEVSALKIKQILRIEEPAFTGPVCRGSFGFGTACGHCERCLYQQANPPRLGRYIVPEEYKHVRIWLDDEFLRRNQIQVGGYYVVYADGYRSYSPAKVFEEGYTLIPSARERGEAQPVETV